MTLFPENSIEKTILKYNYDNNNKEGVKFEILIPISDVRKSLNFIINKYISKRDSKNIQTPEIPSNSIEK
jgi:hypothetical protein